MDPCNVNPSSMGFEHVERQIWIHSSYACRSKEAPTTANEQYSMNIKTKEKQEKKLM